MLENKAQAIRPVNFSFADELHGRLTCARQGEWKIALQGNKIAKLGTGTWELYNLKNVPVVKPKTLHKITLQNYKNYLMWYNKYTQQNGVKDNNIQ